MLSFSLSLLAASVKKSRPVPHKINLSGTTFGNASQYHSKSGDLSGDFRDGMILMGARFSEGFVFHENFQVKSFSLGHRFRSIETKPVLSVGGLDRRFRSDNVTVPLAVTRGLYEGKKLYLSYQFGYIPMTEEFQTQRTVSDILRGGNITVGGSYKFADKWRGTYYLQNYFFNDNNTRLNHDVGMFYGIAPGDPWIWVGIGGGRMSNTKINSGYWTPLEFYSIGPRLDVSFSFWQKYRFSSGLNLNYFKDVQTGDGIGYYTMNRLHYKVNGNLEPYIQVESIQSEQSGNVWRSHGITLGVLGTF